MYDISVIVPVYNVEEYLAECLNSILRQGDVKLQVILIDDGSTDTSGEIAKTYAEKYPWIEYHRITNGGLGHARNYAVQYAKGKYIIFVDSDDVVPDRTYEKMFKRAEQDGSELTICHVDRFNSKGHWGSALHNTVFQKMTPVSHIRDNHNLLYDTTSWNKLILRSFYLEHNFKFPERILYEDIPVTIPMHYLANQVSLLFNVGYHWRDRDGATKSITQNTDQMRNLEDRIAILRMLDKFFDENVKESELKLANQVKTLEIDLLIFVNKCKSISRELAAQYMRAINEYIDEAIDERAFSELRILDQQKYRHVRNNDLDGLLTLLAFNQYNDAPVVERESGLYADLPKDLFPGYDGLITRELGRKMPFQQLDSVIFDEDRLLLNVFFYRDRYNIVDGSEQSVKASLYNEITGEKIPMAQSFFDASKLTEDAGIITEVYRGISTAYCYNGAGVTLSLDLKNADQIFLHNCQYNILVELESRYYNDSFILSPTGAAFNGACEKTVLCGSVALTIKKSDPSTFILDVDREPVLVKNISSQEGKLLFEIDEPLAGLCAKEISGTLTFETEKIGDSCYSLRTDEIYDRQLELYADLLGEGGTVRKNVIAGEKIFNVLPQREGYIFAGNLGDGLVKFIAKHDVALVDQVSRAKKQFTVSALIRHVDLGHNNRCLLKMEAPLEGKDITLAVSEWKPEENGDGRCLFTFDFKNNKLVKNLYSGKRRLYVEMDGGEGNAKRLDLYCVIPCGKKIQIETLSIQLKRSRLGELYFQIKNEWAKDESTWQKRKHLIIEKYPIYRKEEIQPKTIIFESMWGKQYSCNPRALYEYIDQNYPQYTCVWSLMDPYTPIKGNGIRVRTGSLEYYHYLATAKYLVNNVNYPDLYEKRDGQIEIQTMHGTPLKTLGLDVAEDFASESDKEKYIKKNQRWDYLIVQGKFMEDKGYSCFRFQKKYLKCGYPRTDRFFSVNQDQVQQIKEKIGIPSDKKVILYSPTWRRKGNFDLRLDIAQMKEALSDEYILLVRFHHFSSYAPKLSVDNQFSFDLTQYNNIEDLYLISDVMITDYSSTMFDYALLKKPMIFFVYDIAEYTSVTRGLYVDFEQEAPGPLAYTTDQVVEALMNLDQAVEEAKDRTDRFLDKYLTYENGNSSGKIAQTVIVSPLEVVKAKLRRIAKNVRRK